MKLKSLMFNPFDAFTITYNIFVTHRNTLAAILAFNRPRYERPEWEKTISARVCVAITH